MRIAYFDCFSGISGDMTIAAFLDAGLSLKKLASQLAKLKLNGYELKATKVMRGGLAGTQFFCITKGSAHNHRPLSEIIRMIDRSSLCARVKNIAKDIFTRIGRVEAKIHGKSVKDIRLHELGDIDSIIDIVGAAIAVDSLGIEGIYSSKISLGRTIANTKHGPIPIPAPAVIELLKGVPTEISDLEAELVTPTGAGILNVLSRGFGRAPQMKIDRIGYGAGSRDLPERPNMLRIIIGETVSVFKEDRIHVIETNIDDMNPQNFEYLFEKLFREGALDVYTTVIQMKKSRTAFKLTVLAQPQDLERLAAVIFSETTSIGLRFYEADRLKLDRKIVKVRTRYGDVKVKMSQSSSGIRTASPEYDNCVKLAREKRVPLKVIYDEAKRLVAI